MATASVALDETGSIRAIARARAPPDTSARCVDEAMIQAMARIAHERGVVGVEMTDMCISFRLQVPTFEGVWSSPALRSVR